MASGQDAEARELSLIDKVELRIALADNDSKLQNTLNTYLPPLLLKLGSEYAASRNKVVSICQHIITRIRAQSVRLPVKALVNQFRDHPNSSLIRHFDLLFTQIGFTRLAPAERADLLPVVLPGISNSSSVSASHAATLFNLFLKSLLEFQIPQKGSSEDKDLRSRLPITNDDGHFLAFWMGKLILLKLSQANTCPGLSNDEYAFLTLFGKPETWNSSSEVGLNLTKAKTVSLRALRSGLFSDEERLFPAVFASADPNSRISDAGDGLMKASVGASSTLSDAAIGELYHAYFGVSKTAADGTLKSTPPVPTPVRIRILNLLATLGERTGSSENILRIVQQDLINKPANLDDRDKLDRETIKLRSAVILLLNSIARHANQDVSRAISQNVVEALKEFLEQQFADVRSMEMRSLRGHGFEVVGLLASANRGLLEDSDTALLRWLFFSLGEEVDKEVVFSIDSALSACIRPFQEGMPQDVEQALRELLLDAMQTDAQNQRNVRYAALRFANRCLAYNDVAARWIDIHATSFRAGGNVELLDEARKGLDPYWYRLFQDSSKRLTTSSDHQRIAESRASFPSFVETASYLFARKEASSNADVLATTLTYVRKTLLLECLSASNINISYDIDWERKLDLMMSEDENARKAIRRNLELMAQDSRLLKLILMTWSFSLKGLREDSQATKSVSTNILLELCSVYPESMMSTVAVSFEAVQKHVYSNDPETRSRPARIYGILTSYLGQEHSEALQASVDSLFHPLKAWKEAIGAEANRVIGSLMALAHSASRRGFLRPGDGVTQGILAQLVPLLFAVMKESRDMALQATAFEALGQLCLFKVVDRDHLSQSQSIDSVIDDMTQKARICNEKVIASMGHLSMLLEEKEDEKLITELTDRLRDLHEIRQPETQFTVGEALANVGCGWESTALLSKLDINSNPSGPNRRSTLPRLIEKIIEDCNTTKPALKKVTPAYFRGNTAVY